MKVCIEIDIDLSNTLEQRFLQFYQEDDTQPPEMMKSLLLCGFLMIEQGVSTYYDEKYKNDIDNIWKDRCEKALVLKGHLEEEVSLLKAVYEERYTRLYEAKLQAKEEEMRRMQEDFDVMRNAQVSNIRARCSELEDELKQVKCIFQDNLREEKESLQLKLYEQVQFENRMQEEYKRHIEELKQKCQLYEEEYKNALNRTTDYALTCMKDSKVADLEKEVARLTTELHCFKNTNTYKGQQGEKIVRDVLAEHFPACEILDTSKTGGLSDVHLITECGDMYVFESKNKGIITLQDVEKSYTDIDVLEADCSGKLKGYVFVSHRTKNIPKKGNLHIEVKNNVYIAWIGANENDINNLGVYIVTVLRLMMLLDKCQGQDTNKLAALDLQYMVDTLKEKLNILSDNMKVCNTLQESISNMALSLNTLQHNNKELYDSILSVSGLTHMTDYTNLPKKSMVKKEIKAKLQCSQCGASFKRKCDLMQHLSKAH
jgi:hypothetical protein